MNLINLSLHDEEEIISRRKFIINKIKFIGISQSVLDKEVFYLFFKTKQDFNDEIIYLKFCIIISDPMVYESIKNSKYFLSENDKNKFNNCNNDNCYLADFNLIRDVKHPNYYFAIGKKSVDKYFEVLDIYYTFDNYIRIMNLIYKINSTKFWQSEQLEIIFNSDLYNNIYEDRLDNKSSLISTKINSTTVMTYYQFRCGKKKFGVSFLMSNDTNKILFSYIPIEKYKELYGKEPILLASIRDIENSCTIYIFKNIDPDIKSNLIAIREYDKF